MSEDDAGYIDRGVQAGRTLVSVQTTPARPADACVILARSGAEFPEGGAGQTVPWTEAGEVRAETTAAALTEPPEKADFVV